MNTSHCSLMCHIIHLKKSNILIMLMYVCPCELFSEGSFKCIKTDINYSGYSGWTVLTLRRSCTCNTDYWYVDNFKINLNLNCICLFIANQHLYNEYFTVTFNFKITLRRHVRTRIRISIWFSHFLWQWSQHWTLSRQICRAGMVRVGVNS